LVVETCRSRSISTLLCFCGRKALKFLGASSHSSKRNDEIFFWLFSPHY
jgi:hypothetical protein